MATTEPVAGNNAVEVIRRQRLLLVAAASSIALHLAAVSALRQPSGRGESERGPRVATMIARLVPLAAPQALPVTDVGELRNQPTPHADSGVSTPPADLSAAARPVAQPPSEPASTPFPTADATPTVTMKASPSALPLPSPVASGDSLPRGGAGIDQGPHPLGDIYPEFPQAAGQRGGSVTLRLVISERGEVEKITVVSATPPGLFEEAALAAFGRARYAPGLRAGLPVRSEVLYQVDFAPLASGAEASGRTY